MCTLHFDGGRKGKKLTYGCVLKTDDGELIHKEGGQINYPSGTSNISEYFALIWGMQLALQMGFKTLKVYGDSQLIIKQMLGEYKVKAENMKFCYAIAKATASKFDNIEFEWISRNENTEADREGR